MITATMTSKGQITVPKEVRDTLGLATGTRVVFEAIADGGFVLRAAPATRRLVDLAGLIPYDGPPISIDEMSEAINQGASEQ